MGEWQPIETAPRDGTLKMFYSPRGGVCIAPDVTPIKPSLNEQRMMISAGADWPHVGFNATHWMPLPSPPEDSP